MSYSKQETINMASDLEVALIQAYSKRLNPRDEIQLPGIATTQQEELLSDLTPVLIKVQTPHLSPRMLDNSPKEDICSKQQRFHPKFKQSLDNSRNRKEELSQTGIPFRSFQTKESDFLREISTKKVVDHRVSRKSRFNQRTQSCFYDSKTVANSKSPVYKVIKHDKNCTKTSQEPVKMTKNEAENSKKFKIEFGKTSNGFVGSMKIEFKEKQLTRDVLDVSPKEQNQIQIEKGLQHINVPSRQQQEEQAEIVGDIQQVRPTDQRYKIQNSPQSNKFKMSRFKQQYSQQQANQQMIYDVSAAEQQRGAQVASSHRTPTKTLHQQQVVQSVNNDSGCDNIPDSFSQYDKSYRNGSMAHSGNIKVLNGHKVVVKDASLGSSKIVSLGPGMGIQVGNDGKFYARMGGMTLLEEPQTRQQYQPFKGANKVQLADRNNAMNGGANGMGAGSGASAQIGQAHTQGATPNNNSSFEGVFTSVPKVGVKRVSQVIKGIPTTGDDASSKFGEELRSTVQFRHKQAASSLPMRTAGNRKEKSNARFLQEGSSEYKEMYSLAMEQTKFKPPQKSRQQQSLLEAGASVPESTAPSLQQEKGPTIQLKYNIEVHQKPNQPSISYAYQGGSVGVGESSDISSAQKIQTDSSVHEQNTNEQTNSKIAGGGASSNSITNQTSTTVTRVTSSNATNPTMKGELQKAGLERVGISNDPKFVTVANENGVTAANNQQKYFKYASQHQQQDSKIQNGPYSDPIESSAQHASVASEGTFGGAIRQMSGEMLIANNPSATPQPAQQLSNAQCSFLSPQIQRHQSFAQELNDFEQFSGLQSSNQQLSREKQNQIDESIHNKLSSWSQQNHQNHHQTQNKAQQQALQQNVPLSRRGFKKLPTVKQQGQSGRVQSRQSQMENAFNKMHEVNVSAKINQSKVPVFDSEGNILNGASPETARLPLSPKRRQESAQDSLKRKMGGSRLQRGNSVLNSVGSVDRMNQIKIKSAKRVQEEAQQRLVRNEQSNTSACQKQELPNNPNQEQQILHSQKLQLHLQMQQQIQQQNNRDSSQFKVRQQQQMMMGVGGGGGADTNSTTLSSHNHLENNPSQQPVALPSQNLQQNDPLALASGAGSLDQHSQPQRQALNKMINESNKSSPRSELNDQSNITSTASANHKNEEVSQKQKAKQQMQNALQTLENTQQRMPFLFNNDGSIVGMGDRKPVMIQSNRKGRQTSYDEHLAASRQLPRVSDTQNHQYQMQNVHFQQSGQIPQNQVDYMMMGSNTKQQSSIVNQQSSNTHQNLYNQSGVMVVPQTTISQHIMGQNGLPYVDQTHPLSNQQILNGFIKNPSGVTAGNNHTLAGVGTGLQGLGVGGSLASAANQRNNKNSNFMSNGLIKNQNGSSLQTRAIMHQANMMQIQLQLKQNSQSQHQPAINNISSQTQNGIQHHHLLQSSQQARDSQQLQQNHPQIPYQMLPMEDLKYLKAIEGNLSSKEIDIIKGMASGQFKNAAKNGNLSHASQLSLDEQIFLEQQNNLKTALRAAETGNYRVGGSSGVTTGVGVGVGSSFAKQNVNELKMQNQQQQNNSNSFFQFGVPRVIKDRMVVLHQNGNLYMSSSLTEQSRDPKKRHQWTLLPNQISLALQKQMMHPQNLAEQIDPFPSKEKKEAQRQNSQNMQQIQLQAVQGQAFGKEVRNHFPYQPPGDFSNYISPPETANRQEEQKQLMSGALEKLKEQQSPKLPKVKRTTQTRKGGNSPSKRDKQKGEMQQEASNNGQIQGEGKGSSKINGTTLNSSKKDGKNNVKNKRNNGGVGGGVVKETIKIYHEDEDIALLREHKINKAINTINNIVRMVFKNKGDSLALTAASSSGGGMHGGSIGGGRHHQEDVSKIAELQRIAKQIGIQIPKKLEFGSQLREFFYSRTFILDIKIKMSNLLHKAILSSNHVPSAVIEANMYGTTVQQMQASKEQREIAAAAAERTAKLQSLDAQTPISTAPQNIYKAKKLFVGGGNNFPVVKSVLKQRYWWQYAAEENFSGDCDFIWTSWKKNRHINYLTEQKEKHDFKLKSLQTGTGGSGLESDLNKSKQQEAPPLVLGSLNREDDKSPRPQPAVAASSSANSVANQGGNPVSRRGFNLGKSMFEQKQSGVSTACSKVQLPIKLYNRMEQNKQLTNKKGVYVNMSLYYQSLNQDPFKILPLTFHTTKGTQDSEYARFAQTFNMLEQQAKAAKEATKKALKQFREEKAAKGKKKKGGAGAQYEYYATEEESEEEEEEAIQQIRKTHRAPQNTWIIKPGENTNRGVGIQLARSLKEVQQIIGRGNSHSERTYILQKYIDYPLLVHKRKFDFRCFGLLTSINGQVKGYCYQDGYVRTSSREYSLEDLTDLHVHLTNDAIQQKDEDYGKFESGNKISLQDFTKVINAQQPNLDFDFLRDIFPQIQKLIADTFKAAFHKIDPTRLQNSFELFGYDFMLDEDFRLYLIEVNTNPCLEICCPLMARIIPELLDNTFKIVLDPLFPGPDQTHNRKAQVNELPQEVKYQLVFDEEMMGSKLRALLNQSIKSGAVKEMDIESDKENELDED